VFAAGAALYVFSDDGTQPPVATEAAAPTKANPETPKPGGDPAEDAIPSQGQTDTVARLLGEARRLAESGQIDQAKAAVDRAAKIIPGSGDIAQARLDIAQMSTPQYQLARQLARARLAIAQGDRAAAEAALGAAAAIDPAAPQVAERRQQMQQTEQKEAERKRRVEGLLSEMRQAIARHDLVAADRALNEAARLNIHDPTIDPARVELAHAQADAARQQQWQRQRQQ
jgi:hypothetical protein